MGAPLVGDVVIIPFPYSDLSQSKRRPALVLAEAGRGDFLLCQITSPPRSGKMTPSNIQIQKTGAMADFCTEIHARR